MDSAPSTSVQAAQWTTQSRLDCRHDIPAPRRRRSDRRRPDRRPSAHDRAARRRITARPSIPSLPVTRIFMADSIGHPPGLLGLVNRPLRRSGCISRAARLAVPASKPRPCRCRTTLARSFLSAGSADLSPADRRRPVGPAPVRSRCPGPRRATCGGQIAGTRFAAQLGHQVAPAHRPARQTVPAIGLGDISGRNIGPWRPSVPGPRRRPPYCNPFRRALSRILATGCRRRSSMAKISRATCLRSAANLSSASTGAGTISPTPADPVGNRLGRQFRMVPVVQGQDHRLPPSSPDVKQPGLPRGETRLLFVIVRPALVVGRLPGNRLRHGRDLRPCRRPRRRPRQPCGLSWRHGLGGSAVRRLSATRSASAALIGRTSPRSRSA